MKISKTQFAGKKAKQWIDGSAIALTRANEYVIYNDEYQITLHNDNLIIFDATGTKAILPLNNKYINIMKSKENYIAEIQNELNEISMI